LIGTTALNLNLRGEKSLVGAENVESQSLQENVMEHQRALGVLDRK
jgi:hypothetical protein